MIFEEARSEAEVFSDLSDICSHSGYLHVIAYFCYRDNLINFNGEMTKENVLQQFNRNRLLRSELSVLIGLTCKKTLNVDIPKHDDFQFLIDRTQFLLEELHRAMIPDLKGAFDPVKLKDPKYNPLNNGDVIRESIFYGGESAYYFQYRDLSKIKYSKDEKWFIENKGYSIDTLFRVVEAIMAIQIEKINNDVRGLFKTDIKDFNYLNGFTFTIEDLSKETALEVASIDSVLNSLISPVNMDCFNAVDDFNPKNAYPIIRINEGEYLLFQNYSLVEALYETPFFWFLEDKSYKNTAMTHRGDFTEELSVDRLKSVFGKDSIYQGVNIFSKKGKYICEIDVLVVFGNRAIVLQAKSKKLTIDARKGNELSLRKDFEKAVQEAYDQAYLCASYLSDDKYNLVDKNEKYLDINRDFKEIYPICVVSDSYPALASQARHFLSYKTTKIIHPPFVMDVFFLDVLCEMLNFPLYFLSYINRRVNYNNKLVSTHEIVILSYHLKKNLWMDKFDYIHFEDDISAELDLAMMTRRDGVPGIATPEGILTKYKGSNFGNLIEQIQHQAHPSQVDLGFLLLLINEASALDIDNAIEEISKRTRIDRKCHNITIPFEDGNTGLTIHCSYEQNEAALDELAAHAQLRKYSCRADSWHGIRIDPESKRILSGVQFNDNWEYLEEMENITGRMAKPLKSLNFKTKVKPKKIGANEQCPCGSSKKYKKCCRL